MTTSELLCEKADGIARLTINRPERRNALSPAVLELFLAQLDELEQDDSIRVLCITGAGEKAFCSGADLAASLSGDVSPEESSRLYAQLLQRLQSRTKPIVSRVNGHAVGGGLGLALATDIIIAREGSSFGTPEVKVGLFPMMIAPLVLRNMPKKRAMQMILAGETIKADEALQFHMINQVVPADQLDEAVERQLQALCAAAPLAQQRGKAALQENEGMRFPEAVTTLSGHLAFLMQTEDAAEGMSAFFQKRKPEWSGK
jgi:enoyl-CoA hydratase/carnithine racemase